MKPIFNKFVGFAQATKPVAPNKLVGWAKEERRAQHFGAMIFSLNFFLIELICWARAFAQPTGIRYYRSMQYRRDQTKGACYFFTIVTHQCQPILTLPENIIRLREAYRREQNKNPFTIDAIVILPDHLHCLWHLPENDDDYSGRWSRIKRYFSTGCIGQLIQPNDSRKNKREKAIWQRRFWEHKIRDDQDWQNHMDYIHYNPVKHSYVDQVKDWPHSSFLRNVERGLYEKDWGNAEPEKY